jgi:hypothetical protein
LSVVTIPLDVWSFLSRPPEVVGVDLWSNGRGLGCGCGTGKGRAREGSGIGEFENLLFSVVVDRSCLSRSTPLLKGEYTGIGTGDSIRELEVTCGAVEA